MKGRSGRETGAAWQLMKRSICAPLGCAARMLSKLAAPRHRRHHHSIRPCPCAGLHVAVWRGLMLPLPGLDAPPPPGSLPPRSHPTTHTHNPPTQCHAPCMVTVRPGALGVPRWSVHSAARHGTWTMANYCWLSWWAAGRETSRLRWVWQSGACGSLQQSRPYLEWIGGLQDDTQLRQPAAACGAARHLPIPRC